MLAIRSSLAGSVIVSCNAADGSTASTASTGTACLTSVGTSGSLISSR